MSEKMDVRVRARYVAKGQLDRGDIEKTLAALPDQESKVDYIDYMTRFEAERDEEKKNASED